MSTAIYNRCAALIRGGRTAGMAEKISAFLVYDQLTIEEYNDLMQRLQAATAM